MMGTIIGVFDEYDDALQAQQRLLDAGIDGTSIQVIPQRGGQETVQRNPRPDHRGFFARLFGLDDDDEKSGNYAEAVRRGSTAITVSLEDDSYADEVTEIFDDCGAIDIDERVQHWKTSGFTAFDPSAPAYGDEEIRQERESFRTQPARLTPRYTGPERRVGSSEPYNGPERRLGT